MCTELVKKHKLQRLPVVLANLGDHEPDGWWHRLDVTGHTIVLQVGFRMERAWYLPCTMGVSRQTVESVERSFVAEGSVRIRH